MSDKRKKDRGDALKDRLSGPDEIEETAEPSDTEVLSETDDPSKTAETSETVEKSDTEESVKERKNVNMYLPEDLVEDLNIRYSELNAQFRREHGREMEKNRDYYPAVIEAGLTGEDIESLLDIE